MEVATSRLQKWRGFAQSWGSCIPIWPRLTYILRFVHLLYPWLTFFILDIPFTCAVPFFLHFYGLRLQFFSCTEVARKLEVWCYISEFSSIEPGLFKFRFKVTKIWNHLRLVLTLRIKCQKRWEMFSNLVAFSQCLNFTISLYERCDHIIRLLVWIQES